MARLLEEVSRATYARYETRSVLPHHLVEEFAAITGVDLAELLGAAEENVGLSSRPRQ